MELNRKARKKGLTSWKGEANDLGGETEDRRSPPRKLSRTEPSNWKAKPATIGSKPIPRNTVKR